MSSEARLGASFRDPSGFLFNRQGKIYRQINQSYKEDYDEIQHSGFFEKLVEKSWLIPYEEVAVEPLDSSSSYKVIQPEALDFVSYPYEWSFSQLQDAALLTLNIQSFALKHGFSLKDANATNIQFHRGKPVLIDSLSFERYQEGEPWVAYRQFCQHFLAPLSLMARKDVRLSQLLRIYIDGIPLDLAADLLPWQSRFNIGTLLHIHLHAGAQRRYAGQAVGKQEKRRVSKNSLLGLIDSLERTLRALKWKPGGTDWANYYQETNYSAEAAKHKEALVSAYIADTGASSLWDLGANNGAYSRLASQQGIFTVASDYDPAAVELNYLQSKRDKDAHLMPLLLDLTNPSSDLGWAHRERQSLAARGPADAVMALALVHHLAIGNNVPLEQVAEYFNSLASWLIIEFVPKEDSQVKRLLASRLDIFEDYYLEGFRQAFGNYFSIVKEEPVRDSERTLFLMQRNG